MTMDHCANCLVPDMGYHVEFGPQVSIPFMDQYLLEYSSEKWLRLSERVYWVCEEIFNDMLDYAVAHLDTSHIFAAVAPKVPAHPNKLEHRPIHEFQEQRSAHWIDEIIRRPGIQTHYQPIVSGTGSRSHPELIGFELLSRGCAEDGSLIPPARLFEAAKIRNRLFALDRACRLAAVRNAAAVQGFMAFINFLPTSIYNPYHCLQSTVAIVNELGLDPSSIIFEVVESAEVNNLSHLKSILNYYRESGFRYALDDVGTGFNSLEVLAELEPDIVKLAIEFTRGVSRDKDKQAVAKAVLRMTQEKNARSLAEGVEDAEDLACLQDMGYEWFQGYYFGKPAPQPQFAV
ncbi:EAL domain-containing protein [Paenibacillus sp. GCM10023252]|uniref:EAL domain-containing protein n=1 Tax=Paenibacillus sp. GCM10023252 TaxID=3252649 RepID=UPI003611144C